MTSRKITIIWQKRIILYYLKRYKKVLRPKLSGRFIHLLYKLGVSGFILGAEKNISITTKK